MKRIPMSVNILLKVSIEVRPFPQSFLENLEEGGGYYQNPGY